MKLIIYLFLSTICLGSYAQDTKLNGKWLGTFSYLGQQYHIEYELNQEGKDINGFSFVQREKGQDSLKVALNGIIDGKKIKLNPVSIIYNVGSHCASVTYLEYSFQQGQERLLGKWKGDMSFETCPPLTGGNITVFKEVKNHQPQAELPKEQVVHTVSNDDQIGQALINELSKRKYYALIIGIDQYKDEDIASLDQPVKDAQSLAQVLKGYYSFSPEDVTVLTNPKRGEVIDALDALSMKVTEKDNLLVFFAGHGIWNERLNQGYWLPSDAKLSSKADWLSNSTLRDYIGGINSKHTLLIADACFSGGILKERAVFENSRAILEVYKLPSRKAMTSGTLKTVPDKSVFIEYLLKNLIQNEAPLLSAEQLFRQFKTAVINNSANGQVPQYGPISQAGDEGGDFIFLRRIP